MEPSYKQLFEIAKMATKITAAEYQELTDELTEWQKKNGNRENEIYNRKLKVLAPIHRAAHDLLYKVKRAEESKQKLSGEEVNSTIQRIRIDLAAYNASEKQLRL